MDPGLMPQRDSLLGLFGASFGATLLVVAFYLVLQWELRRPESPSRADTQIGLKVALYTFFLVSIGFAGVGLARLFHYLLSGTDTGSTMLKSGLASLLVGALCTLMVWKGLLPRTNDAQFPKASRLAYGTLAATAGVALIASLVSLVREILVWTDWVTVAGAVSDVLVTGLLSTLGLNQLGRMSGWTAPQPPAPQVPQYPPQGYGGPPQAGYPPQGYPPAGGYPPPGGGYPPPGGGYPPPGGGYPPPR